MADDYSGPGDPLKSLQLLWGRIEAPKRGPKSKVALADLVRAAVGIADSEGIDAVSTRRVAEVVGISPMSFYTHIPDKAVLLDLMLDAVSGPAEDDPREAPDFKPQAWRQNVSLVARELRNFYIRHPWVIEIATHRPVLGPNTLRSYEYFLSAFDGLGLSPIEMDMSVSLVANHVHGAVRDVIRAKTVNEQTGMSDDQWWYRIAPFLETIDFSPYPVSQRVGPAVGEAYGLGDPDRAFDFGLERILDGLALLIEQKAAG